MFLNRIINKGAERSGVPIAIGSNETKTLIYGLEPFGSAQGIQIVEIDMTRLRQGFGEAMGELTFVHSDVLGSTVMLTNEAGEVTGEYEYDVFGSIVGYAGTEGTDYLFTNQEYDVESELYYYNARYYNPKLGRFISRDTVLGKDGDVLSKNRYIYVKNNPLKYVDPTGETPNDVLEAQNARDEGWVASVGNWVKKGLLNPTFGKYVDKTYGVTDSVWNFVSMGSQDAVNKSTARLIDDPSLKNAGKHFYELTSGVVITAGTAFMTGVALGSGYLGVKALMGETYYRTMSKSNYQSLQETNKLLSGKSKETFITTNKNYGSYLNGNGVKVKIKTNAGTYNLLRDVGVRDLAPETVNRVGSDMSTVFKGWNKTNAFFKYETDRLGNEALNIGLGKGTALDIFNDNIIKFK